MSFSEGRDRDPLVSDEIGEEERLKDLIYEGPVPSFASLVEYIRDRIQ